MQLSLVPASAQQLIIAADCGTPGAGGPDDCGRVNLTPLMLVAAPSDVDLAVGSGQEAGQETGQETGQEAGQEAVQGVVRGGQWTLETDGTIRSAAGDNMCITADCFVWGKRVTVSVKQ
jgi:hypothetical protein